MFNREAYQLRHYGEDHPEMQRLTPNVVIMRRQNPETGHHVTTIGTDRHNVYPGSRDAQVISEEVGRFSESKREGVRSVVTVEGRVPPVRHGAVLFGGERMPEIDTADLDDAMRKHTDVGLVSGLAIKYGLELYPYQKDRDILLELGKIVPHQVLLNWLSTRQIGQIFRMDPSMRKKVGDYLQEDVIDRYKRLLPEWEDADFTLENAVGRSREQLNRYGTQMRAEEVDYLTMQSSNHLVITPMQQLADVYHIMSEAVLAQRLTRGWNRSDTPDRLHLGGEIHTQAIADILGVHGEAVIL